MARDSRRGALSPSTGDRLVWSAIQERSRLVMASFPHAAMHSWRHDLRMNGSPAGSSLVLIHTLFSRVYSRMTSVPCSVPMPLALKPERGDIGDIARYVFTHTVPASRCRAIRWAR